MATKKSPLARMKDQFKDKETLVDRIMGVVDAAGQEKDAFKTKLLAISNDKLLRLHDAAVEIKKSFGSVEKLAQAAAEAAGKAKDKDFVAKLAKYTPPRLLAYYRSLKGSTKAA